MFKVLKIDGPHIVTDKGMITISPSQYADGGKTHPVSEEDWLMMRNLFVVAPELLAKCDAARLALRSYQYSNGSPDLAEAIADAIEPVIAKAKGQ